MSRDDVKRQVLASTDIVRLISANVHLIAKGRELAGLCPFHDDKNPSMFVSPAKQIYKCFACGAGGDAFSFVMGYHKMTFPEALKYLADAAGIKLPAHGGGESGPSAHETIGKANAQAVDFFRAQLRDPKLGQAAREYVAQRGINAAMVEAFAIGYAPDGWDGLTHAIGAKGWDRKSFEQAGLITPRQSGDGFYDRMRHRLIFPIFDAIGRPIAFGGRKIRQEDEPKYLNSPETPLFNKSATLFGLNLAKPAIMKEHCAIIVEGYTDVIACHQAGVANVVAALGTALTREHAQVLRRMCDRVVLLFDADEAGYKAADRGLQVFFQEPIDVDIAVLPDGLDPADLFAKNDGPALWRQALGAAVDALSFQFQRVRQAFDAAPTLSGRQRIIEEYLRTLVNLGFTQLEPTRRGLVVARLAQLLKLDDGVINDMIRQIAGQRANRPAAAESAGATGSVAAAPSAPAGLDAMAEKHIVGCLMNHPALFHATMTDGRPLSESVVPEDFADLKLAAIYRSLSEWLHDNEELTTADLRDIFSEESLISDLLDAQLEVDRLTGSLQPVMAELITRSVSALHRRRAEAEYQQQKMQVRQEAAGADGDALRRLEMAISHVKSNPSARRMPRIRH